MRSRRIIFLFLLFAIVGTNLPFADSFSSTAEKMLFVIAGQSNAVGQGDSLKSTDCGSSLCFEYDITVNRLKPLRDPAGQEWKLLERARSGSIAPAFAKQMNFLSNKFVCIVTAARGGASCNGKAWLPPYNTWDERGGIFDCAIEKIDSAVKCCSTKPSGVIWLQGERDANAILKGQMTAFEYKESLKNVIVRFRRHYGKDMPFFIIQTGYQQGTKPDGCTAVRNMQQQVTKEMDGVYIVYHDTDKLPSRGMYKDFVHYNQTALNEIGRCAADSVDSILKSKKQESYHPFINRYGWSLKTDEYGRYVIREQQRIAALTDIKSKRDVLVPYRYKPVVVTPEAVSKCKTVSKVYQHYRDYDLTMDIDIPEGQGPFPFIIYVHGGGWESGDQNVFEQYSKYMASHGIAGIRISYSLLRQKGSFKSVEQEIRKALDFVMKSHKNLKLDVRRWGVAGGSAGAQLGSVFAMRTSGCKMFAGFYGAYNLLCSRMDNFPSVSLCKMFLDNNDEGSLKQASACFQIPSKDIPKVLLLHGTADLTINCEQSRLFAMALKEKKADVKEIYYDGYGHSFTNASYSDIYETALKALYDFSKDVFFNDNNTHK